LRLFSSRGIRKISPSFVPMLRPLRSHILDLEHRLQAMRDQLTRPALTPEEREHIEMRMRASELALEHYRQAFELEQKSD
jgi:hypothetical protein